MSMLIAQLLWYIQKKVFHVKRNWAQDTPYNLESIIRSCLYRRTE